MTLQTKLNELEALHAEAWNEINQAENTMGRALYTLDTQIPRKMAEIVAAMGATPTPSLRHRSSRSFPCGRQSRG